MCDLCEWICFLEWSQNPHSHIIIIHQERKKGEGRVRELRRRQVAGPVGLKISDQLGRFQCHNNTMENVKRRKSQKAIQGSLGILGIVVI